MPTRMKAFLIHLITSVILAVGALALVFLVWYPAPLDQTLGVTHIFLLILGIDVIVGPFLTLLVYKENLKLLRVDMTIIIVVQLLAFSYGLATVAKGRPAWLVFSTDQFYLVRVADLDTASSFSAPPEYRHAPWLGPRWVAVQLPETVEMRRKVVSETLKAGGALFTSPKLYSPLDTAKTRIIKSAQPLSTLAEHNSSQVLQTLTAKWPTASSWLPLGSNTQTAAVLLDKNGKTLAIVNLSP